MAKKRRKVRLKTWFKRMLVYLAVFIAVGIYGTIEGIEVYKEYKYKETYEYKIQQVGYTLEETKTFIQKFPEEKLNFLLENEYNESYYQIITQKYYLDKNFDKYVTYKEYHEDTSYEDVIAIVNVHANEGWYNVTFDTDTNKGYLMLVNKFYHLNQDYSRSDIENVSLQYSYSGQSAASIGIENFALMRQDVMDELGVHLMVNSSYRPYSDQEEIYNDFKNVSLKYADSYAARPGYSEHQTGLAIDVTSLENKTINEFKVSKEYEWLKNNCHKYGFILRYPENKEHITGYNTESWHFRYVGKDVAKQIYEEGITFDEYYAYYVEK